MTTPTRTARRSRLTMTGLAALSLALAGAIGGTVAGELTIAWAPANDALTAGYELERLDESGEVVQTFDTGDETLVVIENLEDGVLHRFRVRPYDAFGHRARQPSDVIASMPEPVVASLSVTPRVDGSADLAILGTNFAQDSRVLLRRRGAELVDVSVVSPGQITARVTGFDATRPLLADDVLVAPPVRKNASFVYANPELLDVDRSGHVGAGDVRMISAAFGSARGEPGYDRRLDPNDDGVIDGEDRDLARSATKSRGRRVIDGR